MNELASIPNNHLALQCEACGHGANVAVAALIKAFGNIGVHEVAKCARCSNCRVKGNNTFRIIYVGGSGEAMEGTRT